MYHLYWIHQPQIRFRQHTSDTATGAESKIVRQIAQELGITALHHSILASFESQKEARIAERSYRPKTNIGWNIWVGGGVSPDCSGRTDSEETKKKRSISVIRTKSTRSYICPFAGRTDYHNEETRALIGSYHKNKVISAEHRKAISEKLSREKSPVAKMIRLFDTVAQKTYEFGCVKSASEELGINYSALRSATRNKQEMVYKRWKILY